MANEQNLRPGEYRLTVEEQKKGGKASGAARRKKKALREIAEAIGAAQAPEEVKAKMEALGLSTKKKLTFDEAVMLAQYSKAMSGNVQSANYIADILGAKTQKLEVSGIDAEKSKLDELLAQRKAARDDSK